MNEKLYVKAKGFNQEDLENLVIALSSLRDEQGFLFALNPADVFQPWFLKIAQPKLPDGAPDFLKETHNRMWGSESHPGEGQA